MEANFASSLARVLVHEGGYVNHPADPGGETNKGITYRVYNAWRRGRGLPIQSVRHITDDEVAAIYKAQYWDAIRGDDLPSGVDYCVFDFAVNSGPSRAAKFLQGAVGVSQDGAIGNLTLDAVRKRDAGMICVAVCDARLAWLKRLKTWGTFGKGWGRRVADVKAVSVGMTGGAPKPVSFADFADESIPGKATGPEKVTTSIFDALKDPAALTAGGGLLASFGALAQGDGPIQYALSAVLVLAGLVGVVLLVRKMRAEA